MPEDLRCPVCDEPLQEGERAYTCPNGHSFDRARQGYLNLLRPTRLHGDTLEMLRARRRIFATGGYAPLAEALAALLSEWLVGADAAALPPMARTLLDAGCGEGYYLGYLADTLAAAFTAGGWRLYGMDLAKDAVRLAAGRSRRATWLVANSWDRLPFADGAVGALLTIFAPRHAEEFARVIAPGGLLLVVTPTQAHLAEARAALPWLLTPEPDKDDRLRATLGDAFIEMEAREIAFTLSLDATALADLALMTPHRPYEPSALEAATHAATEHAPDGRLAVRACCIARRFRRGSA